MDIYLRLTKSLAIFNHGQKEAVIRLEDGSTVDGLIVLAEQSLPGLKEAVLTLDGSLLDSVNMYVNGENIRSAKGLATPLCHKDTVSIIPAAAAG